MNDDPNHPLYRRGISVSRSALRRADELARSLEEATAAGDGGIMGAFDEAGVQVGFNTSPGFKGFTARLIGQNSAPYADVYSFVAVLATPNGSSDLTLNNDLDFFFYPANTYNAKEVNGTTTIAVPPGPTSLSASLVAGGTLTVGTKYYWVVTENLTNTATSASVQSPISNEVNLTPTGGNQTASLSWTAPTVPSGFTRTGYSVWRGTSAGGENVLVTSGIAAGTTTYSDTGSAGTAQSPVVGGTAGPIVWIWPSAVEDFWEFEYQPASSSSGSGIALVSKTGTTVDASCTSLKADTDGVITFSHLAANSDQLVVTDASGTQRGVVNTTTQTFAGIKNFTGVHCSFTPGLYVGQDSSYNLAGAAGLPFIQGLNSTQTVSAGIAFDQANHAVIISTVDSVAPTIRIWDGSFVRTGQTGTITYIKSVNFVAQTVTTGTITLVGGIVTAFT